MAEIGREEKAYQPLPSFYDFGGEADEKLRQNFNRISREIQEMVLAFKAPVPVTPKGIMKPNNP
jgi:hypothetical protein